MALARVGGPYIWVSWISKLLVGEVSCQWGAWFRAQFEGSSWEKVPSDFDQVQWLIRHGELLEQTRRYYERQGYQVSLDSQNSFHPQGECGYPRRPPRPGCRPGQRGDSGGRQGGATQRFPHRPGNDLPVRPSSRPEEQSSTAPPSVARWCTPTVRWTSPERRWTSSS